MPLTWDRLTGPKRKLYQYFHARACGHWHHAGAATQMCPFLRRQAEVRGGDAIYFPEALSGNPGNHSVWFMGYNPGGANKKNDAKELAACPNALRHQNLSIESYYRIHVEYYTQDYVGDPVTERARCMLLRLGLPDAMTDQALTVLNLAHCKTPGFKGVEWGAADETTWPTCGRQSLLMLREWCPKVVFTFWKSVLDDFPHGWLRWCRQHEQECLCRVEPAGRVCGDVRVRITWTDAGGSTLLIPMYEGVNLRQAAETARAELPDDWTSFLT